ncbi:MAG: hypothetical protein RL033_6959 [Pseudomonadota bacterium]
MKPSKFPRDTQSPSQRAAAHDQTGGLFAPQSHTFSPDDYAVGQVLQGRFRIEHVIGVGSMGVVLAARHLELDERVAIKFIRAEMQRVPGVMQRFAREAKAAVTIKSEHVAQVFDVGTADGIGPYIVMEYLEGRDLGAVLELEGRLPIRRAVHYVMQACEALAVAHSSAITHRDIKPENLFLTQKGDLELVKLLDFGISKAALTGKVFGDELSGTEAQCLLGTPLYMSPEQIRAGDIDHRTDIWSLGTVLYELITARSAFVADSVRQVWTRILETAPTPLAVYCPEAPPSLQAVIDRCLEKDPDRRYQNVAELAIALLPFAPSRARLYAQRASSILGGKSDSILPAPMPLPAPLTRSFVSEAIPHSAMLALPLPEISAPPVVGGRESRALVDPRASRALTGLALAGVGAACVMLWLGAQRSMPTGSRVDMPASAVLAAPSEPAREEEAPELSLSRTVLVESQPSGALVKVGGQALGLTPLSTLLPVGTQQLSIAKQGYVTEQAFVQLDAAPAGAKAVRTRVILREDAEPAAEPQARTRPAPAPARAVRRPPPARRASAEAAREEATPLAAEVTPEPAPRAEPSAPPLVEERSRVKLVETRTRARLLD